jgi:hypothetical protein
VVGSKWIFKVKRNADGSVERFKARLVAKGYSQRPGFDFTETFAPTVRYSAVRTILAIAALEDMHIHSLLNVAVSASHVIYHVTVGTFSVVYSGHPDQV